MEQNAHFKIKLIIDFYNRISMHHALWFNQVKQNIGVENAYRIMDQVCTQSQSIQIKRLSKVLGFDVFDNLPVSLNAIPEEKYDELLEALAVNWLANDGVWFQAVETEFGMSMAKKCNDLCWEEFSPFEAWSVKRLIGIEENSGLEGLKKALQFRLYAFINKQSITNETEKSFEFQMNDCRVQSARKRKGLPDYPCKSAGLSEYPTFASAIDANIKTTCICCPPDAHPEEHYCSWKFFVE